MFGVRPGARARPSRVRRPTRPARRPCSAPGLAFPRASGPCSASGLAFPCSASGNCSSNDSNRTRGPLTLIR
eukprot:139837-Alexandrium_andersonii.AAC.1